MIALRAFTWLITATVVTFFLRVVAWSSFGIVRRKLSYELWYAVHITAYAGIALAWFHEIPTGGDLALNPGAARYWRILALVALTTLAWRVLAPLVSAFRHRMRVIDVVEEGPGVTSLRISGRKLDRMHAQPGQFFLWRFLARGHWWAAHPFSLSAAPDGNTFRITAKAVGGHTSRLRAIPVGTRVVTEGPF